MGLLQKACETYEAHGRFIGIPQEGRETLVPVSHTVTSAQLEITVDQDGRLIAARAVDKSESKIIIPVTEESGGRTSAPCAHPLCDQLSYIAPYDEKKHALYVAQLTAWAESEHGHPMLAPILTYVKGGSILSDLAHAGLIQLSEQRIPEKEKLFIRWRIVGLDSIQDACWLEPSLFQAFIAWYSEQQQARERTLCMITGENATPAMQHPKGIVPVNGNAKLISANDTSGFTFRGRFTEEGQAATISYLASQKAHNALRWLIANQGVLFGGRTFLCWNPQGKPVPQVASPLRRRNVPQTVQRNPTEYRRELALALASYQSELPETQDGVVIAAFDAATTGRLSLTYYNELRGSDFLQRLHAWDATCCWWNGAFGIQSPALRQIVLCAFGVQRNEKLEVDDRVLKQQIQRLVACRVDRAKFPHDMEQAVVHRVSNLQIYDTNTRVQLLFVACAVIRKYRYDRFKEEWDMSLEPNKHDRSYQFGRLLAVLEKAERDTYQADESREPNAIRRLPIFTQRPMTTFSQLCTHIKTAYLPRLTPASRAFYEKIIGEIVEQLSQSDEDLNSSLSDTYLLGYYLQRNELYKSKKEKETEEQ